MGDGFPPEGLDKGLNINLKRMVAIWNSLSSGLGDRFVDALKRKESNEVELAVEKFSWLLDYTEYIPSVIESVLGTEDIPNLYEILPKAYKERCTFLLERYLGQGELPDIALERGMSCSDGEALFFDVLIKTLNNIGRPYSLKEMYGVKVESLEGKDVSEEQKKEFADLYENNYKDRPRMLVVLEKALQESFQKENVVFHTFYFNGKLLGILVIEQKEDGSINFGKFNVDPSVQGMKIGEFMMKETIDVLAETKVISATCSKGAPVVSSYIERGFIAETEFKFEEDVSFKIVRNDSMNRNLLSKSLSREEITEYAEKEKWVEFLDGNCKVMLTEETNIENLIIPDLNEDKEEKWVLTRFFKDKKEGLTLGTIVVLEKVSKDIFKKYKTKVE